MKDAPSTSPHYSCIQAALHRYNAMTDRDDYYRFYTVYQGEWIPAVVPRAWGFLPREAWRAIAERLATARVACGIYGDNAEFVRCRIHDAMQRYYYGETAGADEN